jgi:hypothetical protein
MSILLALKSLASYHLPLFVCGIVLFVGLAMFVSFIIGKKKSPQLEQKLILVEQKLKASPDDTEMLIAHAELLYLLGTPRDGFTNLERAFELGVPKESIEPTFWACYREVSASNGLHINTNFWAPLVKEAPKLTKELAGDVHSGAQCMREHINAGPFAKSDEEKRRKIIQSLDLLLTKENNRTRENRSVIE